MKASIILLGLASIFGANAAPLERRQAANVTSVVSGAAAGAAAAATTAVIGVESVVGQATTQVVVQTVVPQVESVVKTVLVPTPTAITVSVPSFSVDQIVKPSQTVVPVPGEITTMTTMQATVVVGPQTNMVPTVIPTVVTQYITTEVPSVTQTTQTIQVPQVWTQQLQSMVTSNVLLTEMATMTAFVPSVLSTFTNVQVVSVQAVTPTPAPSPTPTAA